VGRRAPRAGNSPTTVLLAYAIAHGRADPLLLHRIGMTYDALIVGGRVAGGSLALRLARQGRRVLVVERDELPSDTLSTHYMSPLAVGQLAELGVLPDVEAAGFRRITRTRTWIEDCSFGGPVGPPGSYALTPRRTVLDCVILDHALQAGAEVLHRTRAERLIEDGGRVAGAVVRGVGGEAREVRASVVVGADGRSSAVAEWVGAKKYHQVPALRPAYYGYYRGVTPLPDPALEMWFGGDHIGFLFPMRPDEDCLAIELQPEDFAAYRERPQEMCEERLRALPGLECRLRGAVLEGKLMGTRGIDNFFRTPYGPGWALTGDAGYLRDPSTGTGLSDALTQAALLAEALDGWLDGADWDASMGSYHRQRDEALMPGYQATLNHTRMRDMAPEDVAWVQAVLSLPGLLRVFAHAVPRVVPDVFPEAMLPRLEGMAKLFVGER
jgi:flavin-dependent dehydrogenase